MSPSEFKAWLEGFSEAIDGRPTAAQWARIQEQVKKLSAPVSVQHVPNDLYRRQFGPIVSLPAVPPLPFYPTTGMPYVRPSFTASTFAGSQQIVN